MHKRPDKRTVIIHQHLLNDDIVNKVAFNVFKEKNGAWCIVKWEETLKIFRGMTSCFAKEYENFFNE